MSNDHDNSESFLRRHRVAIIATVVTIVSAIALSYVLDKNRYPFSMLDIPTDDALPKAIDIPTQRTRSNEIAIIDTTTGAEYPSINEGARQTNLNSGNIWHNIQGDYAQTGGHVFERLNQ